ncbi:MAG: haloacid dehalogenase type II [Rhodospirillales bacterium]
MQGVKALTFDVFGTVVNWRTSIIKDLEGFGRGKGITADWAGLVDDWRGAYRPTLNKVIAGELPWAKLDELHRGVLDKLLERYGVKGLSEPDKDHINKAWHRLNPWPDSVAGLTRLKKKYLIASLSNGNVALLANMAKHAGLPWDCILSAELFKAYKRDPKVYRGACTMLGLKPREVMMVAAHGDDLDAARRQGMRTGYVSRPGEYAAGREPEVEIEGGYDVEAKDFLDLAAKLGA